MNRFLICIATIASAGSIAAVASAQEKRDVTVSVDETKKNVTARVAIEAKDLTVTTYTPRIFNGGQLRKAASELFGETITVVESKGQAASYSTLPHFVVLGELVLVRDTPDAASRIVTTLKELEDREAARLQRLDEEHAAAVGAPAADAAASTTELRPRYVSLDTLLGALGPFKRPITMSADGAPSVMVSNLVPVTDGGFVVVTETPARLKQMMELVDRVDRPRPQMSLSVMLVGAGAGASGEKLPKDLAASLAELLPGQEFGVLSVGLLRCSTQSGKQCELKMELADGASWSLAFYPEAFNAETSELSLTHCRFELHRDAAPGQARGSHQQFTTSLTLRTGEHVVLGAVGATPTFVVLRAEPVRAAR